MGDMADAAIEQGETAYWLHQTGRCGPDICRYCEEEEKQRIKEIANLIEKGE